MALAIPVSPGELIDKLTILEIKLEKLADAKQRANVETEHRLLAAVVTSQIKGSPWLDELKARLLRANLALWRIEDEIRDCERQRDFGETFIGLVR